MAVDINWSTGVITIAAADMVDLGSNVYQLDMEVLRLDLMDQMDNIEGMPWPKTHIHNPSVTVSGAVLAKVVIILAPYTITFDPTGVDAVNVVGANTNIGDRLNVNSVSVRTSNSAGLQDLNSLQAASFGGAVALDATSSYSGTQFPVGTRSFAVNNLADAKTIADERGLHRIEIMSDITLNAGTDMSKGYEFRGDSPVTVSVTIDPSTDVTNCEFTNMTVTGTLDGNNTFERCHIQNISFFNGAIHACSLQGTITLGGGITAEIYDSWSGIAGGGPGQVAEIDMGGSGQDLLMRNYSGGIDIVNGTGASSVSIDMNSGRVIVASSVTAGNYYIRGVADVYDLSTGTTVVTDQTSSVRAAEAVWSSLNTDYTTTGTFGKTIAQIKSLAQAALGK